MRATDRPPADLFRRLSRKITHIHTGTRPTVRLALVFKLTPKCEPTFRLLETEQRVDTHIRLERDLVVVDQRFRVRFDHGARVFFPSPISRNRRGARQHGAATILMMRVGGDEMGKPGVDNPLRQALRLSPETPSQDARVELRECAALDQIRQYLRLILKPPVAFRMRYDRRDARIQKLEYRRLDVRRH